MDEENKKPEDQSAQQSPQVPLQQPLPAPPSPASKSTPLMFWGLVIMAIIVALLTAFIVSISTQARRTDTLPAVPTPIATVEPSPTVTPLLPTPTVVEAVGSSSLQQVEGIGLVGIEISKPEQNKIISSPLLIEGRANVFEGNVNFRLSTTSGTVVATGFATACMGENPCPFSLELNFPLANETTGKLEAFSIDAASGEEMYLVNVSVQFASQP